MESTPYLTVQDAARELGVTDGAIRMAILKGRLASETLYGRKVVARDALELYRKRTQPQGVKRVGRPRRPPVSNPALETLLMGEEAMSRLWDSPEEDAAWAHLQEAT